MIGQVRTTLLEVVDVAVGEARKLHAELKPDFATVEKRVDAWIARIEAAYELAGVAALVAHDTQFAQANGETPSRGNAASLEAILQKRGVL